MGLFDDNNKSTCSANSETKQNMYLGVNAFHFLYS